MHDTIEQERVANLHLDGQLDSMESLPSLIHLESGHDQSLLQSKNRSGKIFTSENTHRC